MATYKNNQSQQAVAGSWELTPLLVWRVPRVLRRTARRTRRSTLQPRILKLKSLILHEEL